MSKELEVQDILAAVRGADPRERRAFLKKNGYGDFLYKYRAVDPANPSSVNRLRDIVLGGKLWLNSPTSFNDPFDMSAKVVVEGSEADRVVRLTRLVVEHESDPSQRAASFAKMYGVSQAEMELVTQKSFRTHVEATGVYCFAGDVRNILMWSHYAKDHSGLCIQFRVDRDIDTFTEAMPVVYRDEYPTLNWLKSDFQNQLFPTLLTKYTAWSYEKESRIIAIDGRNTTRSFLPEAVTAVIFGCRADDTLINCVKGIADERIAIGMTPITLYRAERHSEKFRLVIRKIK